MATIASEKIRKPWLKSLGQKMPEPLWTYVQYLRHHRRLPNLFQPHTLSEKLHWLRLYYRHPLMPLCVDKLRSRDYISQKISADVLIPLLGAYSTPEQVDFSVFPEQFVLKPNHGSGWVILCRDQKSFDIPGARRQMAAWQAQDYYQVGHEWPYRHLPRWILVETYLAGHGDDPPNDVKFYCFHGEPRFIQVDVKTGTSHQQAFFSENWDRLAVRRAYPLFPGEIPPPDKLSEMIACARLLAAPFPFVRVDLYEAARKIYFGELTFFPGNGLLPFQPRQYDVHLGSYLNLPAANNQVFPGEISA